MIAESPNTLAETLPKLDMTMYLFVLKDRHFSPQFRLFLTELEAVNFAKDIHNKVNRLGENDEAIEQITSIASRPCVFYARFSVEEDCMYVLEISPEDDVPLIEWVYGDL